MINSFGTNVRDGLHHDHCSWFKAIVLAYPTIDIHQVTMISIDKARHFVFSFCSTLVPRQILVEEAVGYVIAEAPIAIEPVPRFDNSAMDGYALRARDVPFPLTRLRVIGEVMAGQIPPAVVGLGEAMRIMTGAPIPVGADAVCMLEHTRLDDFRETVTITQTVAKGTNIRRRAEETTPGDEVFAISTAIGPLHIGVLKSLGVDTIRVFPRPRVGVMSTGDEIVDGIEPLAEGKIRDANRPALLAQIRADGWEAIDLGVVEDDESSLMEAFENGSTRCDAIVTSGGVSVGDRDIVKSVLKELCGETMRWMQVAVKPAKPFAFGVLRESGIPVFGLPGNPMSAFVSYELFARPAIRALAGHVDLDRPRVFARCNKNIFRKRDGSVHVIQMRVGVDSDGALWASPLVGLHSHALRAMTEANAFALLPDGEGARVDELVEVVLLGTDNLWASRDFEPFEHREF